MQALSLGNKLERDKKKLASNLQNKPQTWLVRGLVSVYSSYGYDITYTKISIILDMYFLEKCNTESVIGQNTLRRQ